MVHTKDGSRAVREFLAQGTAKDRKQILKVLKPYVETMAKDDEAQLVLFTALDVTEYVLVGICLVRLTENKLTATQNSLPSP
jgi:hypothetical protein